MKTTELEPTATEARALRMVRALANPARFRIVALLAERKDSTAAQLAAELPLAPSSLFEHLSALREAGIAQSSGEGPNRYYGLDPAALDYLAAFISGLGQRARSWTDIVATARGERGMTIRDATRDDAAAIAHIYNQGIEDRATLETQLRSVEEREQWMAARASRHPVMVAMDGDGLVIGWGSLNSFNARAVYDHVVDFSLYVMREHRGQGVGDALLGALVTRARALGYHKMVLAAFPTNPIGVHLYQRHGFSTVGVYHEQGMLDGKWVDVILMEKILG